MQAIKYATSRMSKCHRSKASTGKAMHIAPMPNLSHTRICRYLTGDKREVTGVGMKMEQT